MNNGTPKKSPADDGTKINATEDIQTPTQPAAPLPPPPFNTSPDCGLTEEEVTLRKQTGLSNTPAGVASRTVGKIFLSHTLTFFNIVMVVLSVCLAVAGKMPAFLLVAVLNTAIGIVQELLAKKRIDSLTLSDSDLITAVRDGKKTQVVISDLVRDDIILLRDGESVPADGQILLGSVLVNEALVTGEAATEHRVAGDCLLSGSVVEGGQCTVRLTAVGKDRFASTIITEAQKKHRVSNSVIGHTLHRLIFVIGIALVPIGVALFLHQTRAGGMAWRESMITTVTALVGMVPEGLILLTSIALAVSAFRLYRKKIYVRDLGCIETLARADVICVDKSGTITSESISSLDPHPLTNGRYTKEYITDVLHAYFARPYDPQTSAEKAIARKYVSEVGWNCTFRLPASSDTLWSAATFAGEGSFILGSPENLLNERYAEFAPTIAQFTEQGFRCLFLNKYDGVPDAHTIDEKKLTPMALIPLYNTVRSDIPAVFRQIQSEGVKIKVFSGDNPQITSEVARQAGVDGAATWVDASTLTDENSIAQAAEQYTVFGKASPQMKAKLIAALQKQKHTVAAVGDGVNDILALQEADCGIAIGNSSKATRQVAHIIIENANFEALQSISGKTSVIGEGRRVINNVQRVGAMFLAKNILSFCLAMFSLFFTLPYPLTPEQLSLLSMLTIGLPALFLVLEPNIDRLQGRFWLNMFGRALPGALASFSVMMLLEVFAYLFHFENTHLYTMSCAVLCTMGICIMAEISVSRFHGKKGYSYTVIGIVTALVIVCFAVFGKYFELVPLTVAEILVLFVLLLLSVYLFLTAIVIFRAVSVLLDKRRAKRNRVAEKSVVLTEKK